MSWYRIADKQQNFSFMDDSTKMESPELLHSEKDLLTLEHLCEDTSGALGIESALIKYGYDFEKLIFPENRFVFVVRIEGNSYVIPHSTDPWPVEATDWIYSLSSYDLYDLYPDIEENFWEGLSENYVMYHGTYEEKVIDIMKNGLEPRSDSRGIENRHTGAGVFMSEDSETAAASYPVVIEVALGKMALDGYTPDMGREEPAVKAEMRNSLGARLGLQDFQAECEAGIYVDTMICRDRIPPKYLTVVEGDEMEPVYDHSMGTFRGNPYSIHGPDHWKNVDRIGMILCAETGADPVVVRWFAALHDSYREDDSDDMGHGPRAAEGLKNLPESINSLSESQLQLLEYAIKHHTDGVTSDDPTIGTCWDADRLDLARCNVTPSPAYMSTDKGRELAESGELWS